MATMYNFENTFNKYFQVIDAKIILHVHRINYSIANLYFTDEMNNKINIPNSIVVYTYDYKNIQNKVILNPINQYYKLCWTNNYAVELNNRLITDIKNNKNWYIRTLFFIFDLPF